ncbi:MAG: entericidin A/B family lipoprotein [Betaproteobacteria bacterium]
MTTIFFPPALALVLLWSARHTVRGVGPDLQKAGEKIEDASKRL